MTLAENAGLKGKEIVSRLYAAHSNGQKTVGFDNEGGKETEHVCDAAAAMIVDNMSTKRWSLKYATQAACTVLRVDQVRATYRQRREGCGVIEGGRGSHR